MEEKENRAAGLELKDVDMDLVSGGGKRSAGSERRLCANPNCRKPLPENSHSAYCSAACASQARLPQV